MSKKQQQMNVEMLFSKKLVEIISIQYKEKAALFTFDLQSYFMMEAISYIETMEEDLIKHVFKLLELEYDKEGELNNHRFVEYLDNIPHSRVEEVFVLVKAFKSIDIYANNVRKTDIIDLKEEIGPLGINVDQVVADIEAEAGDILYEKE